MDIRIWHRAWKRKKGKTYQVCYQINGGPILKLEPVRLKSDMDEQKRELRDQLKKGTYRKPTGDILFADFARARIESWRPPMLSPGTWNRHRSVTEKQLIPEFGGLKLSEIERRLCQDWVDKRATQVGRMTVEVDKATLTKLMTAAVREKLIGSSPAADLDLPPVDRKTEKRRAITAWSEETVDGLVTAMTQRYRAIGELGRDLGMRQGELFAVAQENIDFKKKKLHVRLQIRDQSPMHYALPKRGKIRTLDLTDNSIRALRESIRQYGTSPITLPFGQGDGPLVTYNLLFVGPKGAPLSRDYFNERVWHLALRANGITPAGKPTGIHQLRHHVASVLLDLGFSIADIAEILGDTIQEVYETYVHSMPGLGDRFRKIQADREVRLSVARQEAADDED